MTPRERLLTVLAGKLPDCVPVAPDFSNMIPIRLTGKPFWDIYLYNDPPKWEAYVRCAKRFNIDSLMDIFSLSFPDDAEADKQLFIIYKDAERIITQQSRVESGKRVWAPLVTVYHADNPPTRDIAPAKLGLPPAPKRYEPVEGAKKMGTGPEVLKQAKALMGEQGLVGADGGASTLALEYGAEAVFDYYDNPKKYERLAEENIAAVERHMAKVLALDVKPDFLCFGGSGTLVYQTPEVMRKIALPAVKRGIEIAARAGIPTHVHACGPEKELVRIMAEETQLTVIDPLETPPMGDCDLAELKRTYGRKLVLKGNLHTTDVLLRGSVEDVVNASKRAIDAAAEGGRFILSTGDQCGRDTPDENLRAMIETARTYGRY